MKYVLRMLANHHRRLAVLLRAAMPSESVAFLLCRRVQAADVVIYLADEVVEVNVQDYLRQTHDIASVTPLAMASVAKRARGKDRVIVMAHLHPMTDVGVEFSNADHIGNRRSFEFFHRRASQKEHLAIVWTSNVDECAGLVYPSLGEVVELGSVVVVDESTWQQFVPDAEGDKECFDRQAMLLGQSGQRLLGRTTFAIAGTGGTGSLVSLASIHHGVRSLTLVDDEVLAETNMPRIPACVPKDIDRRRKVDIACEYAIAHAPDASVIPLTKHVEHPEVLPYLIAADLIIVCTDNTTSRAYLNQLAQQYLIPLLDLGVQFTVDKAGNVVNEIGRINLVRPGTPCLWCSGQINPTRLAAEAVPKEERQRDGSYLRGIDDPQPSMLAFNMEVVGRGIQVLIGYLTGLFHQPSNVYEQRSFLQPKGGSMSRNIAKSHREGCVVCGSNGVVGTGADVPMNITSRAA